MKNNATAAAQKWASAMAGASASYTAGVQAVTVAPGQKAAAAQANYLAGVQNKVGEWATNVAAVGVSRCSRGMTYAYGGSLVKRAITSRPAR